MAYPILAQRDSWYTQGNSGILRSTITEIHIKDSYAPAGPVTAQWDGSAAKDGSITVYVEGTVLTIAGNGSGKVQANADSKLIFCDSGHTDLYSSLESVSGLEYFDTTKVTDMTNAFTFCGKLSGLDWGAVDFPACKTFRGAFSGCALTSADLSGWNLGELENMNHAFSDCSNLVDVRLSKTMSNVTNWAACFNDCHSVEIIDISGVVSEKAIAMSQMFERCTNLKKVIGLGNLKTPVLGTAEQQKQTALSEFMRDCANLEEADLTNLDTRQACKLYDYALADIFTGDVRLRKITLGPNFDYLGGRTSIPADRIAKLPTPDPTYIPGADGLWYDASGTAYTPENAVKTVPNTYYGSLELARKEPTMLENGTMMDIGQAIQDRSGSPDKHKPRAMAAAIRSIPSDGDIGLGMTGATVGQIARIKAVNASGKPTAWEPVDMPSGGGDGGKWELIESIDVGPESQITRTAEPDGTPYNFKAFRLLMNFSGSTKAQPNVRCYSGNTRLATMFADMAPGKSATMELHTKNGYWEGWYNGYPATPYMYSLLKDDLCKYPDSLPFTDFVMSPVAQGLKIEIWAVRK